METPFLDHVRHSLMIDRNKDVIIEKLLSLTLEIVCLLAGEDYVVVRRSADRCATENGGHHASDKCRKAQSLITGRSPPPLVAEENPTRRTPEAAKNVLTDAEKLPIKSEDGEIIAWDHLVEQKDAVVVSRPEPSRSAGDSSPVHQRVFEPRVPAHRGSTDLKEDYISGSPPRRCRTPLCSQECQAEPLADGRIHQRCKEEEDTAVPEDVGSGRDDFTDHQEQRRDPVCSEEDNEMVLQEYQSDVRNGIFHHPCKEEDSPGYINSAAGPAISSLDTVALHQISQAQEHLPNHSDPAARQKPHCANDLFACSICGVRFTSEMTFAAHQRFHTEEKSYDCTYCGKSFNQRSRLLSHKRKHTGEKPFSCPVCGRCFAERSALITHQRIHSGEKPFNCTECARSFVQRSSLVKHQRIHTGERPFVCTHCGRCFSQSSNLVRHQRILHQFL